MRTGKERQTQNTSTDLDFNISSNKPDPKTETF